MRTTLDISDDVLFAADTSGGKDHDDRLRALGFRTLPPRGGIVTNELIDRLREQEGV